MSLGNDKKIHGRAVSQQPPHEEDKSAEPSKQSVAMGQPAEISQLFSGSSG